jgi:hypothetical protein
MTLTKLRNIVRRQGGQVAPGLLMLLVTLLAGGVVLFQVGKTTDLRAQAVTAADAAALAGAQDIKRQLEAQILTTGAYDCALTQGASAYAAAQRYAQKNGASVTSFRKVGCDVWVTVDGDEALEGPDARRVRSEGRTATAEAHATVEITLALGSLPNLSMGAGGIAGGAGLPAAELKRLAEAAGVEVRPDSALRNYGSNCAAGVDVVHLADAMKIAILRAEDALGRGISISSAFRTVACQAAISPSQAMGGRVAPPGASMHNYGLAIDTPDAFAIARVGDKAGVCQPFPAPGDDNVHISIAGGPECGGSTGPLGGPGSGMPFGGNAGSFATFEVKLVPYDSGVGGLGT